MREYRLDDRAYAVLKRQGIVYEHPVSPRSRSARVGPSMVRTRSKRWLSNRSATSLAHPRRTRITAAIQAEDLPIDYLDDQGKQGSGARARDRGHRVLALGRPICELWTCQSLNGADGC